MKTLLFLSVYNDWLVTNAAKTLNRSDYKMGPQTAKWDSGKLFSKLFHTAFPSFQNTNKLPRPSRCQSDFRDDIPRHEQTISVDLTSIFGLGKTFSQTFQIASSFKQA